VGLSVRVNGEPRTVTEGTTLAQLLLALDQRPGSVVVERNGEALPPSGIAAVVLAEGDVLEIVRAVAGG